MARISEVMPFEYIDPKNDIVILFIHGIFGSPGQFKPISKSLRDLPFNLSSVLLPGHGCECMEFARARRDQWIRCVEEKAAELRKTHSKIVFVGHSMGCLISIKEAVSRGADALITIASPLRAKSSMTQLNVCARVLLGNPSKDDEFMKSYRAAFSVKQGHFWQYPLWIPPLVELLQMMGDTKKYLSKVTCPCLIIQSRNDETVSAKSADLMHEGLINAPHEVIMLNCSGHSHFDPYELKLIIEKIREFLIKNLL